MRVIAGSAKGRSLRAVPGFSTRPTSDKVKEALFSKIGPYFTTGQVLDLFAGTGALGIEALSRGMTRAVFIDIDKKAIETIRFNLQNLGFHEQSEVYCNEATRALKVLGKRQCCFSLIFMDPPYRNHTIPTLLKEIHHYQLMNADTQIIVEHDADVNFESPIAQFVLTNSTTYGQTAISIYQWRE